VAFDPAVYWPAIVYLHMTDIMADPCSCSIIFSFVRLSYFVW